MHKPFNMKDPVKVDSMLPGDHVLHGDVIVERITTQPDGFDSFKILKDNTLALGEATGHLHRLFGDEIDLRECPKTKVKYLRLVEPAALRHQEHREIMLPPGDYRIGIQKEYDPFEKLTRQVAD